MMFSKSYAVDPQHIDFQGVMDGLFYPFYFEWARHSYFSEEFGINLDQLFELGHMYVVLEYKMKFKKSVHRNETVVITCHVEKHEKPTRVNVVQKMFVDGVIAAEGNFVCTCMIKGRPSIPQVIKNLI